MCPCESSQSFIAVVADAMKITLTIKKTFYLFHSAWYLILLIFKMSAIIFVAKILIHRIAQPIHQIKRLHFKTKLNKHFIIVHIIGPGHTQGVRRGEVLAPAV